MTREDVERLLEVYTFEELILVSDLEDIDILLILYNTGHLEEPQVKPL